MAHVLVVDDSEDLKEVYELVLDGAGHRVSTASDGEEGLRRVAEEQPELVLLDIMMPGVDGLEFLARLPASCRPPLPPVIANSGFDDCRDEALRRGASAFLIKPVSIDVLLQAVEDALATRRVDPALVRQNVDEVEESRDRATVACAQLVAHIDAALTEAVRERLRALARWLPVWHGFGTSFIHVRHGDLLYLEATFNGPPRLYEGKRYPRERVYCDDLLDAGSTLLLNDPQHHPCEHFSQHLDISLGWRFYAGVPLTCRDGTVIGTMCLMDVEQHDLQAEDMRLLEVLALTLTHALEDAAEHGTLDGFPTDPAGIFRAELMPTFLEVARRRAERRGEVVVLARPAGPLASFDLAGPGAALIRESPGGPRTLLLVGPEARVQSQLRTMGVHESVSSCR